MSLINEALKKAQKERGAEVPPLSAMPTVGGESPTRIARRGKTSGFPTGLLVGGGVLVLGLIGAGVFLLRSPSNQPPATAATPPAAKPAIVAVQPAPAPVVTAPAAPATTPSPAIVVPSVAPTTPAQTPVSTMGPKIELPTPVAVVEPPKPAPTQPAAPVTSAPAPVISVPVVATAPAPEPPKPEPPAARPGKLEPRAINFIESLRVAGIRASATDSKVLMNDRVYRLGTIVEHEMGLKLVGITANSLTFEDERGGTYTRTF